MVAGEDGLRHNSWAPPPPPGGPMPRQLPPPPPPCLPPSSESVSGFPVLSPQSFSAPFGASSLGFRVQPRLYEGGTGPSSLSPALNRENASSRLYPAPSGGCSMCEPHGAGLSCAAPASANGVLPLPSSVSAVGRPHAAAACGESVQIRTASSDSLRGLPERPASRRCRWDQRPKQPSGCAREMLDQERTALEASPVQPSSPPPPLPSAASSRGGGRDGEGRHGRKSEEGGNRRERRLGEGEDRLARPRREGDADAGEGGENPHWRTGRVRLRVFPKCTDLLVRGKAVQSVDRCPEVPGDSETDRRPGQAKGPRVVATIGRRMHIRQGLRRGRLPFLGEGVGRGAQCRLAAGTGTRRNPTDEAPGKKVTGRRASAAHRPGGREATASATLQGRAVAREPLI
ncbi:hypothetical protein NCLIV_046180 [Neospora caninum Liverpool]|uniref:Uncharacterized protein n=1 Tax=Neospora caninum (strain Liverpool) TaxID=572307 RepID=F0VLQ8_NEOCL|nr:hypothetical protein NCLIV_046180 [Neospora caninum Liverpool]CBZ54186.1 hypothetical protein NCLIV_046180 [Neospora caninum Liverpool]|eukprot:XP_003884217.1 hypothetical protein NCLIV_046180 [Neospora caninum Liverpool]